MCTVISNPVLNALNSCDMKRYLVFFVVAIGLSFMAAAGSADRVHNLIPAPKEIREGNGKSMKLKSVDARIDPRMDIAPEGYTLKIKGGGAVIRARDARGLIWGKATLKQLTGADGRVPEVTVRDWPAFSLRGFMHDNGRNFRSVDTLKRELDLMSDYKINSFHWHLTDYPAWRIESKAYPRLNDPAYQRKGRDTGRFYSYDEIRDVIAYAKERGITVIPEIDMPGHSSYFDAAFGFGMASPEGMKVLEVCLKEFFDEIGDECPYIHIGSDEVHISNPEEFMGFVEKIVKDSGRTPVSWNPGLPVSNSTVRQIWSAKTGEEIEASGTYSGPYIDSYQGYLNLDHPIGNTTRYFLHRHCGKEAGDSLALGGILCLWNDVRVADKSRLFPHNGMPDGLLAFAESVWCGGERSILADESMMPMPDTEAYSRLREFESRLACHRDSFLYDWDMRWVANADIPWRVTLPQARGTAPERMEWRDVQGGVVDIQKLCEKNGVELLPTMDAWMTTEIYAARDTTIEAWVGFEAPARSDRMSDGIGYQGLWEAQGRLFSGDTEVFPPKAWNEPGKYRYFNHTWHQPEPEEAPYTDEQLCWMRDAAKIPLKAGWNEIKLYCPRVFPGRSWIVTFIPLTVDANGHVSEPSGIKYRRK